jgi:pSer/pThr/pTyr-binding forkhead associated (FHA) protein
MVVDAGSTSGTYVGGHRIAANQPTPIDPNGVIAFGPIPVPVSVLIQVAQASASAGVAPGAQGPVAAAPQPSNPDAAARVKHRTVIGELSLEKLGSSVITIGRTPENQIVVPHAQVSSKHAQIVRQGNELYLQDLGSANGTFVRGQRLAPNQRVPVTSGEKVYIGPMPLLIHVTESQVNVVSTRSRRGISSSRCPTGIRRGR